MARPKKEPAERRTERHNLRFTLAEMADIRLTASQRGLSVADYLHQKCLTGRAVPHSYARGIRPEEITAINNLGLELSRLGNLSNQIARGLHSDRPVPGGDGWETLPERIAKAQEEITSYLRQRLASDD